MTYIDAMNEFFEYLLSIDRSKKTVSTYRKVLTKYYRYLSAKRNSEIYIEDINSDEFEAYLADDTVNLSSISKYSLITAFKSFMSYCFNKGLCKDNVSKEIKQVRCRVKERTSLTKEEFQDLVDNIKDPVIRCVVYMMFYTGCRINEIVQLTMDDVDLFRNSIIIRKPKGHNHKSRTIPIHSELKSLLIEYLTIRLGGDTEDSFFVLKRSGRISDSTVNRAIREAAENAKINRPITNHIIRHTFASLLAEGSVDLKKIQILLGHSNLDKTNTYLHASSKSLRDAVNLLK